MSIENSSSSTSSSDQLSPLNRNEQIRNVENYTPGGEKVKSHGVTFHDQVILSYLCKFMTRENFNYNLACEVDEAGKFDDLVIFFEKDERTVCRLIQVKSKESDSKKLNRTLLSGSDKTFGLKMYFLSYVEILTKHKFETKFACEIDELILHTNIDVDDDLKKDLEKYEDEFFGPGEFYCLKNIGSVFKKSLVKLLWDTLEHDINERKDKIKKDKKMSKPEKEKKTNDLKYLTDLTTDEKKKCVDDFLRKFKFHVKQPNKDKLACLIKKDMKQCLRKYKLKNLKPNEFFIAYTNLYDKIYTFHSDPEVEILTKEKFVDWLKEACTCCKSSLSVCHELNMKRLVRRKFRFEENPIETLKRRIENSDGHILNIVANAGFELTLTKLNGVFKDSKFSLITDEQFLFISGNDIEVEKIEHLIVKCENDAVQNILEKNDDFFDTIADNSENASLKKIILVSRSYDDYSSEMCTEIIDETEWNDLHKDARKKLEEERDVCLQGRNIKLTRIEVSKFADLLKNEILHSLVDYEEIKMGKPIECGNVFIERRISVRNKISADIFKTDSDKKVFLISNMNETQFQLLQSLSKCRLVRSVTDNSENHFLDLCGQHSSETVIWLHQENGEYFVRRSTSIVKIRPYIIESSACSFDLRLLTSIADPLVVIIAEPGMGKSELLSVLARRTIEETPATIVAKVNLNDYTRQFKKLCDDKRTFRERDTAIDFIVETLMTCDTNDGRKEFERNYFRRHFDRFADRLIVLFDGFDEITSLYGNAVLDLIESIGKIKSIRLWVTSRSEEKNVLEDRLNVLSYTLRKFEKEDQRNFFRLYWTRCETDGQGTRSKRLERFVDKLIDVTSKSLRDHDHRMMGVPLQCRMLGVVYNERFEEYYGSARDDVKKFLPESIDILELYEDFVKQKMQIFEEDKVKLDNSNSMGSGIRQRQKERLIEAFSYSGLCAAFTENDLKDILPSEEKINDYMEEIKISGKVVGIVYEVDDSTPVFIHRTFAEYFAAKWVRDQICKTANDTEKRYRLVDFFKRNFFKTKFEVVRRFFDRMSTKEEKGPIFQAVLNNDRLLVSGLLKRDSDSTTRLDDFGRNVLHLCAAYERHELIKLFLKNKQPESTANEKLCGWKPIEYACAVRNLRNVDAFLEENDEDMSAYERVGDKDALLEAAENGYVNLVKYLIKNGVSPNSVNDKNETSLHLAAARGHLEISRYLVEDAAADVDILDVNCSTVLHCAARGGNVDIIKLLIKAELNVNAQNPSGVAPLHEAAWEGKNDAFKYMIEEAGANSDVCFNDGRSVLHCATASGRTKIIELIAPNESGANVKDHDGRTPLHFAAIYDKFDTFKYLIEEAGAKTDVCSNDGKSILHYAAAGGNTEIIKLLAPNAPNLNGKDRDGRTPLHLAALKGNNDAFKYLIEKAGAKINVCDNDGRSILHYVAQGGNTDILEYLAPKVSDVNVRDHEGCTCLHFAAINGKIDAFKYLVQLNADMNIRTNLGRTVLLYAAQGGNTDIIKLLTTGPDVNEADHSGHIPLHFAALSGKNDAFRYLIEKAGAEIDICSKEGNSVLHCAAQGGNTDIIEFITRNESDVNVKNHDGRTPLHVAAINGMNDAFRYLVEKARAKIDIYDEKGNSDLHFAASGGNTDIIKFLDPKKPNVDIKNFAGNTPLHVAAIHGKNDAFKYLIEKADADVKICDKKGVSVLFCAAQGGNVDIMKFLAPNDSNVNVRRYDGATLLHTATLSGNIDIVKYLIEEAGAKTDILDNEDRTVLFFAAQIGHTDIVKLLFSNGSAVNERDCYGHTLLHHTAYAGKNDTFKYLLEEAGVDINIRTNSGRTVLQYAAEVGNMDIIELLVSKRSDVNEKDQLGRTALSYAAMKGKNDAFRYLIDKAGANTDILDKENRPISYYAAQGNNTDIIKFLTPNE